MKKWTKAKNLGGDGEANIIQNFGKIFFPINIENMHWILIVVYTEAREIVCYDSLNIVPTETNLRYLKGVEDYLMAEIDAKCLDDSLKDGWVTKVFASTCQQENLRDCGVHVCINALLLCAELDVSVHRKGFMEEGSRRKIGLDILRGSILP